MPTDLMIFFAAHAGSQSHDHGAEDHHPHRKDGSFRGILAVHEKNAQKKHSHEFLSVLSAVHERCHGGSGDLAVLEKKTVGFPAVKPAADESDCFADRVAQGKSQGRGKNQSVNDFDPFAAVDAGQAALKSDGCSGESRDEGVALAGGYSEVPGGHRPDYNGYPGPRIELRERFDCCRLKLTMSLMVMATDEMISVITRTPMKLKAAAMRIAGFASMQRVVTQVAMALGASVQPLTKMTARVSMTETISMGFVRNLLPESNKRCVHVDSPYMFLIMPQNLL